MKGHGIKILKMLERHGELTLEEISKFVPKKYCDHRDFYIFASLVSNRMIDDDLLKNENPNPNKYKEQILARKFFACSSAEQHAEYGALSWSSHGCSLKDQKFSLTGSGSLYLSELRAKRTERIFVLFSGIFVGVVVAFMSTNFQAFVKACS
ncbi:hypothetical protein [Pseudomonas sp. TTU2014-080ASC]|uniref:hypothetical protein n=1 Tax=Pseudomonas sp. TTU2014-080ASC TaxID=1729724 RepID=UPI00071886D8|nr:hypothetical protein [Pseudomonas sp. TTU2014-080ASC]KRW59405.1 hypothetical protein AO726_11340 [Pseudomonas sp. TTU2014-080ASC]